MRIIIRLFIEGVLADVDEVDAATPDDFGEILPALALKHALMVGKTRRHMTEFEFTGLPEGERFMRVGSDQRQMVEPMRVIMLDRHTMEKHRDN
ncbi:MAG TPA: hypothetical protein VGP83_17235 [Pyrinomonadaceae bacterium]|jgi:hypothetical protein|nr:hypothetical protein [Pyrinomonadaceae bacterium]